MIICTTCGAEYEDFATYCNACDAPLVDEAGKSLEKDPAEVSRNAADELQKIRADTASVHRILGGLYAAVFAVGLLFAFVEGSHGWESLFLLVFLVPASIHLLAARGLAKNRSWGRPVSIIIGFLLLPGFPIGSFLGIYILLQMFRKQWKLAAELS